MNNKYTLVCPAGNLQTLEVAIKNGANAVYLGVEGFNARSKAGFSREDFLKSVKYAHLFGVKIYVTLNILIKDSEIKEVLELADFLYNSGADSFIIQDLGLYYILKNRYKDMDLHLSTQLGIHNEYGAKVCEEKLNAKHIVLSRETLIDDIKKIKSSTNLTLEFFVQGALCVAFSGNCYYSSMMTGCSGNRGTCCQFCRKKYDFISSNNKKITSGYLLSPSDICMLDNLRELEDAGITHFKIEGRNRRQSYVGGATRIYTNALKGIYSKEYKNVLQRLFYRGEYNNLYLNGTNDLINPKYNNHIGIEIGTITKVIKGKNFNEIYFTSKEKVENDDTIKLFDKNGEVCTTTINGLEQLDYHEYLMTTTNNLIKVGQTVNLINDKSLENQIINEKRNINLDIDFYAYKGEKAKIVAKYDDIILSYESENELQEAKNVPLTKESCLTQLSKLGDTPFRIKNFEFFSDSVFMPLSTINDLRRKVVEELCQKILEKNTPKTYPINKELPLLNKVDDKKLIILESDGKIPSIKVDKIVLPLQNFDEKLKEKVDKFILYGYKPYITLPIIARGRDLEIIDKFLSIYGPDKIGLVSNNLYGLNYIDKQYSIIAGEYMNSFNNYAVQFLKNLGVEEVILSPEINIEQVKSNHSGVVKIYGDMYYMCFTHCPKRTAYSSCEKCTDELLIKDEKDSIFNLQRIKMEYCYNYLVSNNTLNNIGIINPNKVFIKLDENNLEMFLENKKFLGTKGKKFTYGLLYKDI